MSSDRRIAANRNNARKSTGPRSVAGKARAARNALRHGLNTPVSDDPALAPEIRRWEAAFAAASRGDPTTIRAAAELQVQLLRIRAARRNALAIAGARQEVDLQGGDAGAIFAAGLGELARLDGYERKALSRRNRLLRRLMD